MVQSSPGLALNADSVGSHDAIAERVEWREFVESPGATCEFLHRDRFGERFPQVQAALPTVFCLCGPSPCPFACPLSIRTYQGLSDLDAPILRNCLGDDSPDLIEPIL